MEISFVIEEDNITIKDYLKNTGFSMRLNRFIKANGAFLINGDIAQNYYLLKKGDTLTLKWDEVINEDIIPSFMPIDIIYEDEYLLVVNKPSNLVSHPSKKHFTNSLSNSIKGYFVLNNIYSNIHLVNRLDAETSGLIIIAKSGYVHFLLSQNIEQVKRYYLAEVNNKPQNSSGVIDLPIMREMPPSIKRYVSPNGQKAVTKYQVISSNEKTSILHLELLTGRTHQIRVHLQAIGHAIIGDKLYGDANRKMLLHCYCLEFIHPITRKPIKLTNYPEWYKEVTNA